VKHDDYSNHGCDVIKQGLPPL